MDKFRNLGPERTRTEKILEILAVRRSLDAIFLPELTILQKSTGRLNPYFAASLRNIPIELKSFRVKGYVNMPSLILLAVYLF